MFFFLILNKGSWKVEKQTHETRLWSKGNKIPMSRDVANKCVHKIPYLGDNDYMVKKVFAFPLRHIIHIFNESLMSI